MTTTVKYNRHRAAYCCMNCYLLSRHLLPQCTFCGATYSNYEQLLTDEWMKQEQQQFDNEWDSKYN